MENNYCILVVDDEKDMTRLLQRTLEPELNCRVTMAFSGEMALNILGLADTAFDLVISDIRMPGMDGFDLLEQLKQKYPETEETFQRLVAKSNE